MGKDIRINNESTTHDYTGVDKIRTTQVEGGSQDWVPLDEAKKYINAGDIEITENGTYKPEDYGYDSFRTVTVAMGDGMAYENTMQVTDPSANFAYLDEYGVEIPDIEIPSVISIEPVNVIKANKFKGPGTITGIDPSTGLETTVYTDEDGNIVKEAVEPEGIRITTLPDKTKYYEGDDIDFTGIIVCAYRSMEGRVPFSNPDWDGPRHNQIPFDQLTFPITTVDEGAHIFYSNTEVTWVVAPIIIVKHYLYYTTEEETPGEQYAHSRTGHGAVMSFISYKKSTGSVVSIYASADPNAYVEKYMEWYSLGKQSSTEIFNLNRSYTKDEKTVYFYVSSSGIFDEHIKEYITETEQGTAYVDKNEVAWAMIYGEIEAEPTVLTIPVQWQTEYQEEPFTDTFYISAE